MNKNIVSDLPLEMRAQVLRDNCDGIELKGFMKPFTQEEMEEKKEELSEISISINDIEAEKTVFLASIKAKLKPLELQRKALISELKLKQQFVTEEAFKMLLHEEGVAEYYDKTGNLIERRKLTPNEMQATIFSINKTGTSNI